MTLSDAEKIPFFPQCRCGRVLQVFSFLQRKYSEIVKDAEKLVPASDDRLVELNFYKVFAQVILGRVLVTREFLSFLLQITSDLSVAFYIFLQSSPATHSLP